MAKTFQCTLVTPEASMLDTQATYANLPAHDGQMGVLPGRGAMLVKLGVGACEVRDGDGKTHHFVLDGGFAQMNDNKLALLCERAYAAQKITAEQASEAVATAQALPKASMEEVAKRDHDMAVAKQMQALAGQ